MVLFTIVDRYSVNGIKFALDVLVTQFMNAYDAYIGPAAAAALPPVFQSFKQFSCNKVLFQLSTAEPSVAISKFLMPFPRTQDRENSRPLRRAQEPSRLRLLSVLTLRFLTNFLRSLPLDIYIYIHNGASIGCSQYSSCLFHVWCIEVSS